MPSRGARGAPEFDGKSSNLKRFFEDVEVHSTRSGLNDQEKINWCLSYVNPTDEETWELLPGRKAHIYADFKKEVFALYPNLDNDRRYTVNDLERLVEEYRAKKILNKDALGDFHRDFMRISVFLLDKSRISERERNRWYLQGFQQELRDRITQRLAIIKSDVNPDDSYEYQDIHNAAVFILNCSSTNLSGGFGVPPVSTGISSSASAPQQTHTATIVKTEQRDTDVLRQIQQQLSALTHVISRASTIPRGATPPPSIPNTRAPNTAQPYQRQGAPNEGGAAGLCIFCGLPDHIMRNCPTAEQYVREKKCMRSAAGRIVLPNGGEISRALRGRWIKEKLDGYAEMFPDTSNRGSSTQNAQVSTVTAAHISAWEEETAPHVTTALWEIAPDTEVLQLEVTCEEENEDDPDQVRYNVLQAEIRKVQNKILEKKKPRKTARFDGVELPSAPAWAKGKTATTTAKITPIPMVAIPVEQDPVEPTASTSATAEKATTTSDSKTTKKAESAQSAPQYRYHATVEDPTMTTTLLNRALDATIQTTPRELLAASPDLRKQLKELVVTKRISVDSVLLTEGLPIQSAESFLQENRSRYEDGPNVAVHSLPLRVIFAEFDNGVHPECILDSGAQIIAMRKDIWQRLDLPLQCEKVMVMESANNTKNPTLGLVQNVRAIFGPIVLTLQVQVVEDAPFEVLLGRPFFALANCVTEDSTNGEMYITLRDPTTGQRAKFVTHPRHIYKGKTRIPASETGFP
jgi:hypothetical protein